MARPRRVSMYLRVVVFIMAIAVLGGSAQALTVAPGFDLFATQGGTFVEFPIPNIGPVRVELEGNPFGPGDTDTIVRRLDGLPAGQAGTVDIELVALSLTSVDPVDIGGTLFDVDVIGGSLLHGSPGPSPIGTMDVRVHDDGIGGGVFNAELPVFALINLTEVGNPTSQFAFEFNDVFQSAGVPWSHDPPPEYPTIPSLPAAEFFASTNPFGDTREITREITPSAVHVVTPSRIIPEPTTLTLLALGAAGLVARRRRRMSDRS